MVPRASGASMLQRGSAATAKAVVVLAALSLALLHTPAQAQTEATANEPSTASANGGIDTTAASTEPANRDRKTQRAVDDRARQRMRDVAQRFAAGERASREPAQRSASADTGGRDGSGPGSKGRNGQALPTKSGAGEAGGDGASDAPASESPGEPEGGADPAQADPTAPDGYYENRRKGLGARDGSGTGGGDGDEGWSFGGGWILETLTALGIVIGLILLGRWAWIKLTGQVSTGATASTSGPVEVLSRTAIAPKNHVLLLRVGNRVLIVSDSAGGMHTLAEVHDPEEVADLLTAASAQQPRSLTSNFKQALSRVSGHFDQATVDQEDGRDDAEHHFDRSRSEVSSLLSRLRGMGGRGGGP